MGITSFDAKGTIDLLKTDSNIVRVHPSSGLTDAFGRLRISNSNIVFDSRQIFDDDDLANNVENYPQFWDNQQLSGGGTSTTFDVNTASTTIAVGATTAGVRVRQSKRRMNYQAGKSQRLLLTGVMGVGAEGITQRYGMFDANNGLFFEVKDGEVAIVMRTNVTGSPVDDRVPQSEWNIDHMFGKDESRVTLDLDKTQIFYIDFEWLGVGSVRFGFIIDGVIYYVHQMDHANVLTNVYMSTPNLPIRAEIRNDGTGPAYSMKLICVAVDSEGGVNPNGISRTYNNGATVVALPLNTTKYAVLGVRLRASHLGLQVDFNSLSVLVTTANDTALWELQLNPTIAAPGAFVYADIPSSGMQGAVGTSASVVTANGTIILSGYAKTGDTLAIPPYIAEKLGATIAGVADELVVVCRPIVDTTSVLCALNWRELL